MLYNVPTRASHARNRLVGQLSRAGERPAAKLAKILAGCSTCSPCRSAACAVCGLLFQESAVAAVEWFIREPARGLRDRMHATTIVPAARVLPPATLTPEAFATVAADIGASLANQKLPPTIVGLEVSLNEDASGEVKPHWAPHGHGLGLDWLSPAQVRGLRDAFPPSPVVKRPVWVEPLDRDSRALRYPFKPERYRRVTQPVEKVDDRTQRPKPKRRPLRPWQAVALALVEHEVGFRRRLLTHGIDVEAFDRTLDAAGWPRDGP